MFWPAEGSTARVIIIITWPRARWWWRRIGCSQWLYIRNCIANFPVGAAAGKGQVCDTTRSLAERERGLLFCSASAWTVGFNLFFFVWLVFVLRLLINIHWFFSPFKAIEGPNFPLIFWFFNFIFADTIILWFFICRQVLCQQYSFFDLSIILKRSEPYGVVVAYRILVPGTPVQTWVGLNQIFSLNLNIFHFEWSFLTSNKTEPQAVLFAREWNNLILSETPWTKLPRH